LCDWQWPWSNLLPVYKMLYKINRPTFRQRCYRKTVINTINTRLSVGYTLNAQITTSHVEITCLQGVSYSALLNYLSRCCLGSMHSFSADRLTLLVCQEKHEPKQQVWYGNLNFSLRPATWHWQPVCSEQCKTHTVALSHSSLVMLRHIEIFIRCRYIVPYRIARGNVEIFDILVSTFWYVILPNFHVWCQEVLIHSFKLFIETLTEFFAVIKFREILQLLPCQDFRKQ